MDIDELIKFVKANIITLTKHFPYTEADINYITLAYIAIVLFDPTLDDMLDEVLVNTFIWITDEPIFDVCERIFPSCNNDYMKKMRALYFGYSLEDGEIIYQPMIVVSNTNNNGNNFRLLGSIIHELKHALNDVLTEVFNDSVFSGLCVIDEEGLSYSVIDEVFNSYLEQVYVDILMSLKKYHLSDYEIYRIIQNLEIDSEEDRYSYSPLVKLCLPILQNKEMFWKFYNATLYKDFGSLNRAIEKVFDYQLSWCQFYDILDGIDLDNFDESDLILQRVSKMMNKRYLRKRWSGPKL